MSRLTGVFSALHEAQRTALIPFITAGDPSTSGVVTLLHTLVAAGADAIELGVPFSDPMADGPVIQGSSERALARGVSLRQVLAWVREFRQQNQATPIILMGYLNPVEIMGMQRFAEEAADAGVDGVILVDMTPEEAEEASALLRRAGVDPIFLLAPTSGPQRVAAVKRLGSGFVYYVSLRGITGSQQQDWDEVLARVVELRRELEMPMAIGFGIRDAATAQRLAQGADAVVIGSALVQRLQQAQGDVDAQRLATEFLAPIRAALDEGIRA
ncbi:tryptophan synthase subunit alpha [Acidithiobacillus sp. IBUN Pt1247-S3]|uniref:tryptophan synthase subunit alpha n=1 Tax=Acidithiobacillus sp. IBUN Pt1247-S3 TaxID=3166642 RepID=UPI0034E54B63